jgi:hypothetical protein
MENKVIDACFFADMLDELLNELVGIQIVNAQTTLDRHFQRLNGKTHGTKTIHNNLRVFHQLSPKGTADHPFGRATTVEIDLPIAVFLCGDDGSPGETRRVASSQLEHHWLVAAVETQLWIQSLWFPVDDRVAVYHLRVQRAFLRQES